MTDADFFLSPEEMRHLHLLVEWGEYIKTNLEQGRPWVHYLAALGGIQESSTLLLEHLNDGPMRRPPLVVPDYPPDFSEG